MAWLLGGWQYPPHPPPLTWGKQRNTSLGMGEEFCFSPVNLEMANLPKVTEMVAIGFQANFIWFKIWVLMLLIRLPLTPSGSFINSKIILFYLGKALTSKPQFHHQRNLLNECIIPYLFPPSTCERTQCKKQLKGYKREKGE